MKKQLELQWSSPSAAEDTGERQEAQCGPRYFVAFRPNSPLFDCKNLCRSTLVEELLRKEVQQPQKSEAVTASVAEKNAEICR